MPRRIAESAFRLPRMHCSSGPGTTWRMQRGQIGLLRVPVHANKPHREPSCRILGRLNGDPVTASDLRGPLRSLMIAGPPSSASVGGPSPNPRGRGGGEAPAHSLPPWGAWGAGGNDARGGFPLEPKDGMTSIGGGTGNGVWSTPLGPSSPGTLPGQSNPYRHDSKHLQLNNLHAVELVIGILTQLRADNTDMSCLHCREIHNLHIFALRHGAS